MSNLQKAFQNKAKLTANRGLRMANGGAVPDGDGDADDGLKGYDAAGDDRGLRMNHGGPVRGPGTGTSDSVPAHLSAGEYVLPADTVRAVGVDKLDAMKDATHKPVGMRAPGHYADGGLLEDDPVGPANSERAGLRSAPQMGAQDAGVQADRLRNMTGMRTAPEVQAAPVEPVAPAAAADVAPAAQVGRAEGLGRSIGGAVSKIGPTIGGLARATLATAPLAGFGDYKVNDPGVDSSAGGVIKNAAAGDFSGAWQGLRKGAVEAGLDSVSGLAKTADMAGSLVGADLGLRQKFDDKVRGDLGDSLLPATAAPQPARTNTTSAAASPRTAQAGPDYSRLHAITAQNESGNADYDENGRPVTSPTGAKYAMQVQPTTAANPGYGIKPAQSDTPEEYNRVGKQYLSALNQQYGDPAKAWAAYNAGPGNVDKALADAKKNGGNWMDALASYQSPDNHKQTVDYVGKNMAALGGYAPAAARGLRAGAAPAPGAVDENGFQKDGRVQIIRGLRSTYALADGSGQEQELNGSPARPDYLGEAQDAVLSGMRHGVTPNETNGTLQATGLRQNADAQMQLARNQQQMNQLEHQRAAAQFAQTNALSRDREQRELEASVQKRQQDASNQMQKDLEAANTTVDSNGKPTFDGEAVGRQRRSFERGMASLGVKSYADLDQNDREQMHAAAKLMDKVESDATNWPIPWKADHLGTSDPSELFGMTRDANGNGVMRNGKVIPARFLNKKDSDHIGGVPTDEFKSLFNQRSK